LNCSIDPRSGTLVLNSFCLIEGYNCVENGSVFVYKDIKRQPKQYGLLQAQNVLYSTFDSKGNLFADGLPSPSDFFVLGELPKGAGTFVNVPLDRKIYYSGFLQWDGKYLALGDQEAGNQLTSSIHQVEIRGGKGTVVSTTKLQGSNDVGDFWIQGSSVLVTSVGEGGPSDLRSYGYPQGGAPTILDSGFDEPTGVGVSLAIAAKTKGL
jgi:hypothetical protein